MMISFRVALPASTQVCRERSRTGPIDRNRTRDSVIDPGEIESIGGREAMMRSALFAAAIALPVIAGAQDNMDQTGSIIPIDPATILTEEQARDRLAAAGYTAIGTIDRDADGIWRTTAMKGDNMMSVAVTKGGAIEDR
jgi:putative membrane protein